MENGNIVHEVCCAQTLTIKVSIYFSAKDYNHCHMRRRILCILSSNLIGHITKQYWIMYLSLFVHICVDLCKHKLINVQ